MVSYQINFRTRLHPSNFTNEFASCLTAIDATECPVNRPSDPDLQKLLYSGKKKIHTLKYESMSFFCDIVFFLFL